MGGKHGIFNGFEDRIGQLSTLYNYVVVQKDRAFPVKYVIMEVKTDYLSTKKPIKLLFEDHHSSL